MARITVDEINKELEEFGWKLISTEYKNLDSELIIKRLENFLVFFNSLTKVNSRVIWY